MNNNYKNNENITDSEIEDDGIIQENTTEHEWEIISKLHHCDVMQLSEIDMLGRRDTDRQTNWSNEYQSDEYTTHAINFIETMRENRCIIHDDIP